MELPNGVVQPGTWDLRPCVEDYLGRLDFNGQSILEIGPASGFLTFAMEARGGRVTAFELGRDYLGDVVPHFDLDAAAAYAERATLMNRVINSFWYSHERLRSTARVFYGDVRSPPEDLGNYDIGVLGAILLHCRDPLAVLQTCAERCSRLLIVEARKDWMADTTAPSLRAVPTVQNKNSHTWWEFSPNFFQNALAVFGFEVEERFELSALAGGHSEYPLYTLVARKVV